MAAVDLAQLEGAINFTLSGGRGPQQEAAARFVAEFRQRPDAWSESLKLLYATTSPGISFVCLQILEACLADGRISALDAATQQQVRTSVVQWVLDKQAMWQAEPVYLRTKAALVITLLIKFQYPETWPDAFFDIQVLQQNVELLDLYFRVHLLLDDEVVQQKPNQTQAEAAHNMIIKDTMRATPVVQQFIAFGQQTLVATMDSNSHLAGQCLSAIEKYVEWIDIGLVTEPAFIGLISSCLLRPALRVQALAVFYELVSKGMDAEPKFNLIASLRIVEMLQSLPVGEDEDVDWVADVAELCNLVGECLLTYVVMAAGRPEMSAGLAEAAALFQTTWNLALRFMTHFSFEVVGQVFEFVGSVVREFKRLESVPSVIDISGVALSLLQAVYTRYQWPEPFDSLEDEHRFFASDGIRNALKGFFNNMARCATDGVLSFLVSIVRPMLADAAAQPAAPLEAAIMLVHDVGELVSKQPSLATSGPLFDLVCAIHRSNIASHPHPRTCGTYIEMLARYHMVLVTEPSLLHPVVTAVLGAGGLRHRDLQVRCVASYQLKRLVAALMGPRKLSKPMIEHIMNGIRELVVVPYPSGEAACLLSPDGQANLFEIVGLFVGANWLDSDLRMSYLEVVVKPVLQQLAEGVQHVTSGSMPAENETLMAGWLERVIGALAPVLRGFNDVPAALQATFRDVLVSGLQVHAALPGFSGLRRKVLTLLHQLVKCLGPEMLPSVPQIISVLLPTSTAVNIEELLMFLLQLVTKYQQRMAEFIFPHVYEILGHIFTLLPPPSDPRTDATAERQSLTQHFLKFVNTLASNRLGDVFLAPQYLEHLPTLLTAILNSINLDATPDAETIKNCFNALTATVGAWMPSCAPGTSTYAVLASFYVQKAVPVSILCAVAPGFNFEDPQLAGAADACVQFQWQLVRCGAAIESEMAAVAVPSVGCPADYAAQYVAQLKTSTKAKDASPAYKTLCLGLRSVGR